MNLLLKNTTILEKQNPFHNQQVDIEITDGIISKIGKNLPVQEGFEIIEKENLHVSQGWLDTSVVFGEPGFETTETIENGLKVAAKSGFTSVFLHSNTNPAIDNQAVIQFVKNKALNSVSNLHVVGSLTKNSEGVDLAELFDMKNAGAVAFGDYKKSMTNANLLKIAFQYVENFDGILFIQPMNKEIKGKGFVNEGVVSTKLGLKGIPAMAEEMEIERNIALLEYTNGKLHIPTITTKKSVELIAKAQAKGLQITCGVSVNNLVLNDEELVDFNSNTKIYPPLRTEEDRKALIDGVLNNVISVITSDHCPVNIEQKQLEYDLADYGSIGLESAFGALQTVLPTEVIVDKFTSAKSYFKIESNSILEGNKAEMTLFNPNGNNIFSKENILSFSKNSIMIGKQMKGKVYGSINNNKIEI
ncbi:dihydroorotase [Flavobacterium urocaniciphilum]|uniref:Dihydroorotase n=1 Tax=Flavobacterium urocaniciphilum TaxID=1299341 RepID=A0A1H9D3A7_9FLAO|nr:dihydroorotase [Flavobacterium urocaniciphilum]SEQ07839.1 dihydroorotase [Flavobacterium urocaniciphilum]